MHCPIVMLTMMYIYTKRCMNACGKVVDKNIKIVLDKNKYQLEYAMVRWCKMWTKKHKKSDEKAIYILFYRLFV
jgi:hypothetical protein